MPRFPEFPPPPPPVPPAWRCAFCLKPIEADDQHEMHVQTVYDGLSEDGRFIRKRPGKVLRWHRVCELPEDLKPAYKNRT